MRGSGDKFIFKCTDAAKKFLLDEGIDFRYGARHLKRAIERFVVNPLANLSATGQARIGDVVVIDLNPETQKLEFFRDEADAAKAAAAIEAAHPSRPKADHRRIAA